MIEELLKNQREQQSWSQPSSVMAAPTTYETDNTNNLRAVEPSAAQNANTVTPSSGQHATKRQPEAPPSAPARPAPASVSLPLAPSKPVGHSHSAKGWEPAVVAHTLENTIKAASAVRAKLKQRYGEGLASQLFTLDSSVSYGTGGRRKEAEKAGVSPQDWPKPTPTFLDPSSRALLAKRFLAKLAAPKGDSASKRFVIAFGGHSSAAAHGNFFNQSYAFAFERLLQPVFAAAGLELVVRNHAMGGTGCVPSAYCVANVYGDDLDALSWDFGMTDGRNIDHAELYFRQAVLQTRQEGAQQSSGNSGSGPQRGYAPIMMLAHNTDSPREDLLKYYMAAGFEVAGIRMNQVRGTQDSTTIVVVHVLGEEEMVVVDTSSIL